MNQPTLATRPPVQVQYVGLKDQESDHLYGTGITWFGRGDVKEVQHNAWQRMRQHADVWREYEGDALPAAGDSLIGSDKFPTLIEVGEHAPIALVEVVNGAFDSSQCSVAAWNAMPQVVRDTLIDAYVQQRRARAASKPKPPAAEVKPASGPTDTDLEAMDRDALFQLADYRKLNPNRNLGKVKLLKLLRGEA